MCPNKMTNKLSPDVSLIINRADNIGLSCHAKRQQTGERLFPVPVPDPVLPVATGDPISVSHERFPISVALVLSAGAVAVCLSRLKKISPTFPKGPGCVP